MHRGAAVLKLWSKNLCNILFQLKICVRHVLGLWFTKITPDAIQKMTHGGKVNKGRREESAVYCNGIPKR